MLDSLDPCQPVTDPEVPDGFASRTAGNITLAWRLDPDATSFQPSLVVRAVQGLAEAAAEASGTPARDHLLVVVYPTLEAFRGETHAPSWAGGLYDGAVRLPYNAYRELGISLETARHEVMHAQLHTAIGCMPTWFDEGIATYFGGETDIHALLGLLRDGDLYDVDALAASSLQDVAPKESSRVYAQSLVMVMYALAHHDGLLHTLVALYRAAPDGRRARIWARWFPDAGTTALVDFLGRRLFELPPGAALDAILHGTGALRRGRRSRSARVSRAVRAAPGPLRVDGSRARARGVVQHALLTWGSPGLSGRSARGDAGAMKLPLSLFLPAVMMVSSVALADDISSDPLVARAITQAGASIGILGRATSRPMSACRRTSATPSSRRSSPQTSARISISR